MKAIQTKYIGPSTTRGSRIKAFDGDNSITIECSGALSNDENHKYAAKLLCAKLNWKGTLAMGVIARRGAEISHVFVWCEHPSGIPALEGDVFKVD